MNEKTRKTVLLVDDAPANLQVLNTVLHKNYRVKIATSGEKALEIARRTPSPDLILLDIMMPGIDGYHVIKKLKENPLTASIPVIFISARCHQEDHNKSQSMGAVTLLEKPIDVNEICHWVNQQLHAT